MSWKLKPVSLLKNFSAGISIVTMCISPVAQGAAAADQKTLINQYLKETGLTTKKMTINEYWKMVRHVYPPKLQKQMDDWVAKHKNELMPSISASSFKDADNKEQVRLVLSKDGESVTLTFTGDDDIPLKVNSVPLTKKELLDVNNFDKMTSKLSQLDSTFASNHNTGKASENKKRHVLTYGQYNNLSARKRAEYLIELRLVMEAAQKAIELKYGTHALQEINNKYEWVLQFFFGDEASAKSKKAKSAKSSGGPDLTGINCIYAGYLTQYGESGSCAGAELGAANFKAQLKYGESCSTPTDVPCNPLAYGFQENGQAFCVPGDTAQIRKKATENCNKKSPLDGKGDQTNIARIIKSFMKTATGAKDIDLKFNKEGKISQAQHAQIKDYLEALNKLITDADTACGTPPLAQIKMSVRKDQDEACNNLHKRLFALDVYKEEAPVKTETQVTTTTTNECNEAWQEMREGECGCKYGKDENGECLKAAVVIDPVPEECGFWCNYWKPIAAVAVTTGVLWWLLSRKHSNSAPTTPTYVAPAAPPDPGTVVTPCPAPNTLVNGVCTTPVIVPPPPAPTSEGGTVSDPTGKAGGIR